MTTRPFAPFMNRTLGHPAIGFESEADVISGLLGVPKHIAQMMAQRRRRMQQQRMFAHPAPQDEEETGLVGNGYGYNMGAYDDELGDDTGDLEMGEAEIEELGEDDISEDVGADASPAEIGYAAQATGRKIQKLESRLTQYRSELAALPPYKVKRRKKLNRLIMQAQKAIGNKEKKLDKKRAKLAAALGVPIAAVAAAGTAAGIASGVSPSSLYAGEMQLAQAQGAAALGMQGAILRSPLEGNEVRLPFTDSVSGDTVGRITVPAGNDLRESPIIMVTPTIAFASFKVIGVDWHMQAIQANGAGGFPLGQLMVNCLLDEVIVNGDINLFYASVDVAMGAQVVGGNVSIARTIPGLRENPILDRTNQATLRGSFRQEITTTEDIEVSYTAALVVRRMRDPAAERKAGA